MELRTGTLNRFSWYLTSAKLEFGCTAVKNRNRLITEAEKFTCFLKKKVVSVTDSNLLH